MTRDERGDMVSIPWEDFDLAAQEAPKAVLGLRDHERFLSASSGPPGRFENP